MLFFREKHMLEKLTPLVVSEGSLSASEQKW